MSMKLLEIHVLTVYDIWLQDDAIRRTVSSVLEYLQPPALPSV